MANQPIIIPVAAGELFRPEDTRPVQGGGSRMVKMVPVGDGKFLPCLIRSRVTSTIDSEGILLSSPSYECLLLVARDPYVTMRAYVEVNAWPNFPEQPLEW